jgi:multiple sugar transport system permease protein
VADFTAGRMPAVVVPALPRLSLEMRWGLILLIPYAVVFALFIVYPMAYGLWLGTDWDSYVKLWRDPIYNRTAYNTLLFVFVAVNLQMGLALLISGFFVHQRWWVRALSVIFILPWVVPSVASILSVRWMLNTDWGMINTILFEWFDLDGPKWLTNASLAMSSIIALFIWRHLPFWALIMLAGRLAISKDLYEAAEIDGANAFQRFRYVTWPSLVRLYITSTLLATIWCLGEFNTIYLLTAGGPYDATHVLATLGVRYAFLASDVNTGVATVLTALPVLIPLAVVMLRQLRRTPA